MANNTALIIQKKAYELFKEYGYKNVKIEDICAAASITKSTFYYHYKTKDALLENYVMGVGRISSDLLSSLVMYNDSWEQLWASIKLALNWAAETGKPLLQQVIIYDIENAVNSFDERKRVKALHCSIIEKGQLSGRFMNKNAPESLYHCISTLYRGALLEWASSEQEEIDYDSFKNKLSTILCVQEI